jgi:hypothetical protein
MKKYFLLACLSICSIAVFAQSLSHVSLNGASSLASFAFTTDQQVIIKISPDGKILEWGTEMQPGRYGYYQGKLDPYMGRVEYYGPEAEEALRGKVKYIGSCAINYYSYSYPDAQKNKVKTIGSIALDYYMDYDNESYRGKLKTAGSISFTYYASFDNESFKGKLKTAGNTALTYYSVFDDKYNKGKIKSIGTTPFNWYNEFDRKELQGALKSGATIQKINGVNYNIWQ